MEYLRFETREEISAYTRELFTRIRPYARRTRRMWLRTAGAKLRDSTYR
jgi:hypothetical protein